MVAAFIPRNCESYVVSRQSSHRRPSIRAPGHRGTSLRSAASNLRRLIQQLSEAARPGEILTAGNDGHGAGDDDGGAVAEVVRTHRRGALGKS
jgi:hypothetical protein